MSGCLCDLRHASLSRQLTKPCGPVEVTNVVDDVHLGDRVWESGVSPRFSNTQLRTVDVDNAQSSLHAWL